MKIDISTVADVGKKMVSELNDMADEQLDDILHKAWFIIGHLDIKPLDGYYEDAEADTTQKMSKDDVILSNKIADIQLCQYHITYCRDHLQQVGS